MILTVKERHGGLPFFYCDFLMCRWNCNSMTSETVIMLTTLLSSLANNEFNNEFGPLV